MRRRLREAEAMLAFGACALAAGVAAAQVLPTAAPTPAVAPAYGAVAWSELEFSAHKFFLGASTAIRVEAVPASVVAAALPAAPTGRSVAIPEGESVAITMDTHLPFGRHESVRLYFDPSTGEAFGGEKTMRDGGTYHKVLRYTRGGLFTWRSAPAGGREASLPPADWSERKAYLVAPPAAPPSGAPVADSYALIYLVSAAHLDRRGEEARIFMLADDRFIEMTFTAGGMSYERADFEQVWPGGRRHREGNVLVRHVRATGRAVGAGEGGEDVELGFLGMRGALTVDLEVGTDLPIALSGRVEHIGELTVRLRRAVLTCEPPPPASRTSAQP